jgi:hypothetical protein
MIIAVDEFQEIGWRLRFDISILKCDEYIEADVILLMTATFSEFILLDVLNDLASAHQSGHLKYLIDRIIAH